MSQSARVISVDEPVVGFCRFRLDLDGVIPEWAPGDKLQVSLDDTTVRTITPYDAQGSAATFLVYLAGHGPLTSWLTGLTAGDSVQVVGPRRSLRMDSSAVPILVGDETSLALAAAWCGQGSALAQVYEVNDAVQVAAMAEVLGLSAELVERVGGDAHHPALGDRVVELLLAEPEAPVVLTGRAQTVRELRRRMKAAGVGNLTKVKAYWDDERIGMD